MKRSPLLFFIILCLALTACGKSGTINGHTARTAYRSVKMIKERLPPDNKVEFEVSFWTIRDANSSDDAFLDTVDGKDPWEIIDMAKEIYQQRKTSGYKGYEKYNSWAEMIAQFDKERIDQEKKPGSTKRDESRKNGTILYDMRAPER
ncbi:MAG: hypothetical protein HOO93_14085 [Methyloglobulus sp.]|nr:hypothetical protein [Methyloglobulus sp.]